MTHLTCMDYMLIDPNPDVCMLYFSYLDIFLIRMFFGCLTQGGSDNQSPTVYFIISILIKSVSLQLSVAIQLATSNAVLNSAILAIYTCGKYLCTLYLQSSCLRNVYINKHEYRHVKIRLTVHLTVSDRNCYMHSRVSNGHASWHVAT